MRERYNKIISLGIQFLVITHVGFLAQKTYAEEKNKALIDIIQNYSKKSYVKLTVEKTITSEIMGSKTLYIGKMWIASGKFRYENASPEKNWIIFTGEKLFNVQFPSKDFGGPLQVAVSKIDKKNRSQILMTTLASPEEFNKLYKIKNKESLKTLDIYSLEPVDGELLATDIRVSVLGDKISELSYRDDVGNLVVMNFKKTEYSTKKNEKIFNYVPPKDAQVTEI